MSSSDRATTVKLSKTLYHYCNDTNKIQLIRVANSDYPNLEKIVFPQQRILFEATPEAQLKIYNSQSGKPKLEKTVFCRNLKV